MTKFLAGFVAAIIVFAAAVLAVVYAGFYNVAATRDDTIIESWVLNAAMVNSVKACAEPIIPPTGFNDEEHIHQGFHLFDEMCVQCHGAPGKKRGEVGFGLRPRPPSLSEAVRRWNTAQLFWILKHGIRATGMPAFGETHSEAQLWSLVAFVQKMPNISPDEYTAPGHDTGPQDHGHEHQHDSEHQHNH